MSTAGVEGMWESEFSGMLCRIRGRFGRIELRGRAEGYLRGLLNRVERKNSWQLAESVGYATPHGIQRLLGRANWDADLLREDLRKYVADQLGCRDGILVVDETGFLKKGKESVGVHRQYSGTAGRIENCQVGVFLSYRSRRGSAFMDRSLYLPESWTNDEARCRKAGVPEGVGFATKIELAREMIGRALEAGVPARWVTADEAYGNDSKFRRFLEDRGIGYVVAVNSRQMAWVEFQNRRVAEFFASCPAKAWKRLSCGEGAKGPRTYDWAVMVTSGSALGGPLSGVLARRSIAHPEEIAYYKWSSPRRVFLADLVHVAGSRWSIESGFEQAKQEVGLDNYEVRSWDGWHRHVTLALLAHAFLEVLRIKATGSGPKKTGGRRGSSP